MEDLAAAISTIPPESHVVKYLQLKSSLPRRVGDVTICTQCSLDRLERLEAQSKCWSGVLCAAVMTSCPCNAASLRHAKQCVQALHARVEAAGGPCRLDIILVRHPKKHVSLPSCRAPWKYPINALRNVALRFAITELVVLLDVDLLPGAGIQEELWKTEVFAGYYRACTDLRRVIVLPALQHSPHSETGHEEESPSRHNTLETGLRIVSAGKANVVKMVKQGTLSVFASDVFVPGHGPTDTERWISSAAMYQVQYKDGYEPYFLCSRRLIPWYDERFTGYGRNKIIHAFHVAVSDVRFWVHPDWFVVHLDHPLSPAWQATLGHDPLASQRLLRVQSLYETAKSELVSLPSHTGVCLSPGVCTWEVPPTARVSHSRQRSLSYHWKKVAPKTMEGAMGHWGCSDKPPNVLLQNSSPEYLQALHDLRYHFATAKLRPVVGNWPLFSKLLRKSSDITLVTVATWDRLQRLSAQCRLWKGVICAAVYAPHNVDMESLQRDLIELHREVERARTCRLDLILVESATRDRWSCCCQVPGISSSCHTSGARRHPSIELCPINALRNAALELATTDLVYLLDVDLLPAPSLHEYLTDEKQYKCLWRTAVKEKTVLVVPSFQYSWEKFNASRCTSPARSEDVESSYPGPEQAVLQTEERCLESLRQEASVISRAEMFVELGVHDMRKGLTDGWLYGFHVKHYRPGHGPTDFDWWRDFSPDLDTQSDICCDICQSYAINYEEGFEPYIICSRELIPRFDQRFVGYGKDKISFFYHLQLSGFGFKVLVNAYALDIPHARSPDWMQTFGPAADDLQHIRIEALYQRVKRELRLRTGESDLVRITRHHERYINLETLEGRHNKPNVEGLQLAWQGEIVPLLDEEKAPLEAPQEPASTFSQEEVPAVQVLGTDKSSQREDISNVKYQLSEDDATHNHFLIMEKAKDQGIGCYNFGFYVYSKVFGADSKRMSTLHSPSPESASKDSPDLRGYERMEELRWDTSHWQLKCHPDSLSNCSVVKTESKERKNSGTISQDAAYSLRVSMSAGSWSPQASRLAGIKTGGVAARSILPMRGVKEVLLRYMVRFPCSFQWVKGGALPGLWVNDLVQTTFGWRRAGRGEVSSILIGQALAENGEHANTSTRKLPSMSRPFFFVGGQWHAMQIAVSVRDQAPQEQELKTSEGNLSSEETSNGLYAPSTLDFQSVSNGALLQIEASVDFETVSRVTYSPYMSSPPNTARRVGHKHGARIGLNLCCYFGGKTKDWATQEDTHIDFSQFQVWTDL